MPSASIITSTNAKNQQFCALCGFPNQDRQIIAKDKSFCCHGCLAVYQILEVKDALDKKDNHPLFHQAIRFGLISNPSLIEKIASQEGQKGVERHRWVFEVGEMWCPFCAELIHLAIGSKTGILRCHVDYITDLASIEFDPCVVSKETIKTWITSLGYKAVELHEKDERVIPKSLVYRFAFAGFAALNVMMFTYPLYATYFDIDLEGVKPVLAYVSLALTLPVMAYSAYPIYRRMGSLGMETLVGIGTFSALILSIIEMVRGTYHVYFDTITVLITFLLLGKMIESKAKFSTKTALTRLHHAMPRKGRKVFADGLSQFVPMKEIRKGDQLMVYAGERIVLDGIVLEGEGSADESLITGEVTPIHKKTRSKVLSGTILQNGVLTYEVTCEEDGSTLHKILSLVEHEVGLKSVFVTPLERIVRLFTPAILALAVFTTLGSLAFGLADPIQRGLALLLIACPCAIGIAIPLVESRLLHLFAEMGAIVRNRRVFTLFPKITAFIFDKTGTLTEGRYSVLKGLETVQEKGILRGLAIKSQHPVAVAIANAVQETSMKVTSIQEVAGRGITGLYQGQEFGIGSFKFLLEKGISTTLSGDVYFFCDHKVLAALTLGDAVRPDAAEMLSSLSGKKILLSGDNNAAIAKLDLPLDEVHGEYSPLEKQEFIATLQAQGSLVAMTGDGINDAPALAKADIGISMVSATDISIQVSDILLTQQKLTLIPALQKLSKRGLSIIKQNLFWAFVYNFIGMALAIAGLLTPLFASFAMIMSSLFVILNAQRVKK